MIAKPFVKQERKFIASRYYSQQLGAVNPVRAGLFGHASGPGGQNLPAGKRWPLEASDATVEATKQTNIVPDIFLYL